MDNHTLTNDDLIDLKMLRQFLQDRYRYSWYCQDAQRDVDRYLRLVDRLLASSTRNAQAIQTVPGHRTH
jgi:hypothetical protein